MFGFSIGAFLLIRENFARFERSEEGDFGKISKEDGMSRRHYLTSYSMRKYRIFLAEHFGAERFLFKLGLFSCASVVMGLAAISPVAAQNKVASGTLQVTNLSDAGPGSLRNALATANSEAGDDVITFAPGLTGTITLGGTHLVVSSNVTIQGPQDGPIIVNANRASRVLLMNSGQVKISHLTLTGGKIGGGGYSSGPNDGGGIRQNEGQLTLENCTLSGNTVTDGFGGGMIRYGGSTILRQCTIAGNVATGEPGTPGDGGGLDFEYGTTTISNCTIAGNSAGGYGGGVFLNPTATATFDNTIIAGNTSGRTDPDIVGKPASAGHNLLGRQTTSDFTGEGDQVGTASALDPRFVLDSNGLPLLATNGGPTQTLALRADSPAIDAGDTPLTSDQRSVPRPFGKADDIGAYELSDLAPNAAPSLVSMAGPGGATATVSGSPSTVSPLLNGVSPADSFVTFSTTVRDPNGSDDLDEVYFILGSNANELRLIYNAASNLLSVKGVPDSFAPGDANVLTTSSGALDCGATTVTRSGNDLTIAWRLKVTTTFTLKQGLRLQAQDKPGVRSAVLSFGTWTFTSASNLAPALAKVMGPSGATATVSGTPPIVSPLLNGQSNANQFVTFTTTVSDSNGGADLGAVYFILGSGASELRLAYYSQNNLLVVSGAANSFAPGSFNALTTSNGALDCSATTVTRNGNDLTIAWRLRITTTATLKQGLRLQAQDKAGARSAALSFGTWTFSSASNVAPTLVSMAGPSGATATVSGTPPVVSPLLNGESLVDTFVTFTTTVRDGNGNSDLDSIYFIMGSGAKEVRLTYSAASNRLSAPGGSPGSFAPGSANVLTTPGGVLDCAATKVTRSGSDLTIAWRLKVTSAVKQGLRLQVQDKANVRSPALGFGNWTFTGSATSALTAPSGGSS